MEIPELEKLLQGRTPIRDLRDWLMNEGEKRIGEGRNRRNSVEGMKGMTRAELRNIKRMAEAATGRKLDLVSDSPKDNVMYCTMQEHIGDKLEAEGRQLCAWADALESLAACGFAQQSHPAQKTGHLPKKGGLK